MNRGLHDPGPEVIEDIVDTSVAQGRRGKGLPAEDGAQADEIET